MSYERDKERQKLYYKALESRLHELKIEKNKLNQIAKGNHLNREQTLRYSKLNFQIQLYMNKLKKENDL